MRDKYLFISTILTAFAMFGCADDTPEPECDETAPAECASTNVIKTCQDGHFKYITCENGCNPTTKTCYDRKVCSIAGCPAGLYCNPETQNCETTQPQTQCNAADYPQCNGNSRITCENGQIKTEACGTDETCNAGTCQKKTQEQTCNEADYPQCSGNNKLTCENGQIKTESCGTDETCIAGVCTPNEQTACNEADYPQCRGNSKLTCENGQIVAEPCKTNETCLAGACQNNSQMQCEAKDYPQCDGQNRLLCENGQIKTESCSDDETCNAGVCQKKAPEPNCNEAEYPQCSGNDRVICENGQIKTIPCQTGETCEAGICKKNKPEPQCDEDEYPQCNGNFRVTCVNGQLKTESCEKDKTCNQGVCEDIIQCEEADYPKCDDNMNAALTCVSGKIRTKKCMSDQTCDKGLCVDNPCEPETKSCREGKPAVCNADKEWDISTCNPNETCVSGECVEHGTAPEIKECPALTIEEETTCSKVKNGTGAKLVLRGDVLGLEQTLRGGSVVIENSKITYVGCEPDMSNAIVITCPDSVISPAFINGHEHITFSNGAPQNWGNERFDHRHDWRKGHNSHTKLPSDSTSANNGNSVVEVRALMSGTTSIFGSGSATGLARNLDVKSSTIGGVTAIYQTFPLNDAADGLTKVSGCDYTYHKSVTEFDASCPYGPHIAEGINQEAVNEMRCLSGEGDKKARDIFKPNVAVIHGIGATVELIKKMADNQVKLIWSPRTNISLYGDTAQAPLYDKMGVTIGLGTDWIYSGSATMLRELKCVDYMNQNHYSRYFTDYEIWKMPTWNNAIAFGVDKYLGQIAAGYTADVVMFKKSIAKDLYRAVIDAENEDILLVTMNGNRIYGDANVMDSGSTVKVCQTDKKLDLDITKPKSEITDYSVIKDAAAYDVFFCDEPKDEPSCVPARTRAEDTSAQNTTLYNGDYTAADDADGDGIKDDVDNCPTMFNPIRPMDTDRKQADADGDGYGDICDPFPLCAANDDTCEGGVIIIEKDTDEDGVPDTEDNCPNVANPQQEDADEDGLGDVCDPCPNGNDDCAAIISTLDFSCTTCKSGTGYTATYTETIDGATVSATGMFGKYNNVYGVTLTGDANRNTRIEVANIKGIGTLNISYQSYNPTGGKGTLNITAGTFSDQLIHTYAGSEADESEKTTMPFVVNDKTATSFTLVPKEGGKVANDDRIHITKVTWTSFE